MQINIRADFARFKLEEMKTFFGQVELTGLPEDLQMAVQDAHTLLRNIIVMAGKPK
jgi:hypothetical protein